MRKAALTVFATLLLLSLGLAGEVAAQVNLTIAMRDSLAFDPGSFSVSPGEPVSLTLINAGGLPHTFTLFAQADANVPVSDIAALQAYYNSNAKIVDLSHAGGEQSSTAFPAPMTEGTYTFVCMTPGHAAGGMHGTMRVTSAPPTVAILVPTDGSTLTSTSVTVSGTASDDVGVDKVELGTDGMTWVPAAGTTSWSGTTTLAEGPNTIFARATDTGGNTATVSIAVTVDTGIPTVAITSPAAGAFVAAADVEVTWVADATSGIDHFEASLDGGTPVVLPPTATSHTFSGVADGSHTVAVEAFAVAGSSRGVSVDVTVDATPPTLSIASPASGSIVTSSGVEVAWASADATSGIDHIEVSLDGGTPVVLPATATGHTFTSVADGSHTVVVTAFDVAGNSVVFSFDLTVDTNVFSLTGPYGSGPLIGTSVGIIAAAAAVTFLLIRRRRPKGKIQK